MSLASEKFELQIKRIHDLLEQSDAEVTWNDHLPDPDNPEQRRQIDISIKVDNKLTLIECRIHKERQNVKWIEELMGRRVSLFADTVIAVSASGFTKGAIVKAKAHGVILRDILSLTEQEILQWGKTTTVWVSFFRYENIVILFAFDQQYRGTITENDVEKVIASDGSKIREIFDLVASANKKENPNSYPGRLKATLSSKLLTINGAPVARVVFTADFEEIRQTFKTPSVVAYDEPRIEALERSAFIENVEIGEFEIVQSTDVVSVVFDLSPLNIPNDCQFHRVNFDFKRPVEINSVYIIGLPELHIPLTELNIGVIFK